MRFLTFLLLAATLHAQPPAKLIAIGIDGFSVNVIAKAKMPTHTIAGADLEAWKTATAPVVQSWVEARTKAGDKGAEVLAQETSGNVPRQ